MKKLYIFLVSLGLSLVFIPTAYAAHVNGYYRSNGTYVNGYERSAPDGNPYNNYSYPGNYNPNTGKVTGGNSDTYLNNYYSNSASSYTSNYPTTPTCPINSYYDGVSSCKCNYGYSVSGGSCVSTNTLCHNQVGYNSSYNSSDNTCQCDSGYILNASGKCTLAVSQPSQTSISSNSGVVVYNKAGCDYFIVSDGTGSYSLFEWYGGYNPSNGEILKGNFHTYGFHDFYDNSYTKKTHVWIEDWLLSVNTAVSKYTDKCM